VREDAPGNQRLVAYLVLRQGHSATAKDLRGFLQAKLPRHMIPAAFVMLAALPLTSNGKLNRQALPAPEWSSLDSAKAFVAPRTPLEKAVVEIWAEVLARPQVGIYDDFFDLGGHSLLSIQIMSRVRNSFEVELPVNTLFEVPTVAGLTELIENIKWGAQGLIAVAQTSETDFEEGRL
jgi:acyl carrier protein